MVIAVLLKSFLVTIIYFILSASYIHAERDSFGAYRNLAPSSSPLLPQTLKHYTAAQKLIQNKLTKKLSRKEASILRALDWLIGFADKDENFDFVSTNFFLLLYEMTASRGRIHQKEVAQLILETSFARAQKRLSQIYPPEKDTKESFIGLLQILLDYPQFQAPYYKYYTRAFSFKDEKFNFQKAQSSNDYRQMYEHLVSASFLYYYLLKDKATTLALPENSFLEDLKKLEKFEYKTSYPVPSYEFVQLGYLATHVVLVLTNYGQFAISPSTNARKAARYIQATFDKVRDKLGYLDLYAEYIQCLKILNIAPSARINKLEDFLFDLQRPDGSWGTEQTFKSDPYTAFHPTWAVITALNQ